MRSLAPVLALAALVLAGLAGSAYGAPGRHTIFAAPAGQSLRGRQAPPPEAAPPVRLVSGGGALPGALPALDGDVCRRGCDRTYYFCLAADTPDACGPSWGQCRAGCGAANVGGLAPR